MLHGRGFRTELDGLEKDFGFLTTRFVDADSEIEAKERAVAVLKAERKFTLMSRSLPTERIDVEEIVQVSFWTHRFSHRLGFSLYLVDKEAATENAEDA